MDFLMIDSDFLREKSGACKPNQKLGYFGIHLGLDDLKGHEG